MTDNEQHPAAEGEQSDTRPFLCIPYWTTAPTPGAKWDIGVERPLPSSVVSYLCPGIHAGPYEPGEPLSVWVDVRNSGGGSAPAIVTILVYWANPTVGFAHPNFFAASTVPVMPSRTSATSTRSATMTATIPAAAPDHICLLVAVSNPEDKAGSVCDPIGDRHWAQRNLMAVTASQGAPAPFAFTVANPFADAGRFLLAVSTEARPLPAVEDQLGAKTTTDVAFNYALLDGDGVTLAEGRNRLLHPLELDGRASAELSLLVDGGDGVPAGEAAVVEVRLLSQFERSCGSLGLVVLGGTSRDV